MIARSYIASEYRSPRSWIYVVQNIGDSFHWDDSLSFSLHLFLCKVTYFRKTSEQCLLPDAVEGEKTERPFPLCGAVGEQREYPSMWGVVVPGAFRSTNKKYSYCKNTVL